MRWNNTHVEGSGSSVNKGNYTKKSFHMALCSFDKYTYRNLDQLFPNMYECSMNGIYMCTLSKKI